MFGVFGKESEWTDAQLLADMEERIILKFQQEVCGYNLVDQCVPQYKNVGQIYYEPISPYNYSSQESCENSPMESYNNPNSTFSYPIDNSPYDQGRSRSGSTGSYCNFSSCSSSSLSLDSDHHGSENDDQFDEEIDVDFDDINIEELIPKSNRGRKSKDDEVLEEYGLYKYFSAMEFVRMSLKQVRQVLKDPTLTQVQKQIIKKVRRRGRNKIAARKCRHRRMTHSSLPINWSPPLFNV